MAKSGKNLGGRPRVTEEDELVVVPVRMTRSMKAELEAEAVRTEIRGHSALARNYIREGLNRAKKK